MLNRLQLRKKYDGLLRIFGEAASFGEIKERMASLGMASSDVIMVRWYRKEGVGGVGNQV
jgi:hypothetical protein